MSWRDPTWRYTPANETAKPGYLARRFKEIRARQKKEEENRQRREQEESNVSPLPARAVR